MYSLCMWCAVGSFRSIRVRNSYGDILKEVLLSFSSLSMLNQNHQNGRRRCYYLLCCVISSRTYRVMLRDLTCVVSLITCVISLSINMIQFFKVSCRETCTSGQAYWQIPRPFPLQIHNNSSSGLQLKNCQYMYVHE